MTTLPFTLLNLTITESKHLIGWLDSKLGIGTVLLASLNG